jgi:hypothetical protein
MRKELTIIGSTESQYILLMMNSEFLKRKSRGKYERVCKVPKNMSTNQIQKLAYDSEKRIKFFRKEKLKNLQSI